MRYLPTWGSSSRLNKKREVANTMVRIGNNRKVITNVGISVQINDLLGMRKAMPYDRVVWVIYGNPSLGKVL